MELADHFVEREFLAIRSSVIALTALAVVAALSGLGIVILPILALRLGSIIFNHCVAETLRATPAPSAAYDRGLRRLSYGTGLAACLWCGVLWPMPIGQSVPVTSFLLTVIVVVILIVLTVAVATHRPAVRAVMIGTQIGLAPVYIAATPHLGLPVMLLAAAILMFIQQVFSQLLYNQTRRTVLYGLRNRLMSRRLSRTNQALKTSLREAHWLATHDLMTGLFNRHETESQLEALLADPALRRHSCVLLIDLDHFKEINDKHGHCVGDRVLERVGASLGEWQEHARQQGQRVTCGRWGGEEFLVLAVGDEGSSPAQLAETLRERINRLSGQDGMPAGLLISASIGVAPASGAQSVASLIGAADKALYAAKDAGRNCWRLAA